MKSVYLDIVVFVLLALGAIRGLEQGFIGSSKLILSVGLALYVSSYPLQGIQDALQNYILNPTHLRFLACVLTGLLAFALVQLLALFLQLFLSFSIWDRILGMFFGACKSLIVVGLLLYLVVDQINLMPETHIALQDAKTYSVLHGLGEGLVNFDFSSDVTLEKFIGRIVDFDIGVLSNDGAIELPKINPKDQQKLLEQAVDIIDKQFN